MGIWAVAGAMIGWSISEASTPCMKNQPVASGQSGCSICHNFGNGTSSSCEVEDGNPVNQECTDPTNVDGIVCNVGMTTCDGESTVWDSANCEGDIMSMDTGCPDHRWLAGGWSDHGDQPVCPQ